MTCNLVSVVKLSTLCLSTLIVGCVQKTREVEEKIPEIAEIAKPAPAAPPFDGRRAFQKVVDYLKSSIPAKTMFFQMNDSFKDVFTNPSFDKEKFQNYGVLQAQDVDHPLRLANYDWDPIRKEGIIYWECGTHIGAGGRVYVSYRVIYRVMLYESNGKLEVGKIEECKDDAWKSDDVTKLSYSPGLRWYKPSSNFGKVWDFILENYDK